MPDMRTYLIRMELAAGFKFRGYRRECGNAKMFGSPAPMAVDPDQQNGIETQELACRLFQDTT
jgi:hypothetical protein